MDQVINTDILAEKFKLESSTSTLNNKTKILHIVPHFLFQVQNAILAIPILQRNQNEN